MSAARVVLEGVRVRYAGADRDALGPIDLDVAAGEFIALVGPSGCGKTTLLRTVNRLQPIDAGRITIDGTNSEELDPVTLRRSIGYAIQATGLFSHMSVARNVGIVPELLRWDRARIDARIDAMLELVRLDPVRYRDRRPRELSGGEAQRVGVARALAGEPRLLLMDEPFGALDAIVRRELQHELRDIIARVGTTTIFVTHDVNEAVRLADRIVVLHDGRIEQCGEPLELADRPATAFVRALFASDDAIAERRAARPVHP